MASVLFQFNATCELMNQEFKELYQSPAAKKNKLKKFLESPLFF